MRPRLDLTGRRFGRLVCVAAASDTRGRTAWQCRCDCGREVIRRTRDLRAGRVKSCGCLGGSIQTPGVATERIDLAGHRVGRLAVVEPGPPLTSGKHRSTWLCQCDCGRRVVVETRRLRDGHRSSCGCLLLEQQRDAAVARAARAEKRHLRASLLGCAAPGCTKLVTTRSLTGLCEDHRRGRPRRSHTRRGDRWLDKQGYVHVRVGKHPFSAAGSIQEHRWVMANHLGRRLLSTESVHHKNGNRQDNRIENLELWSRPQLAGQRVVDLVAAARQTIAQYTSPWEEDLHQW